MIIKHSWQPSDGFRIYICKHCGLIRYWDDSFKKLMYKTRWKIFYFGTPPCKRTYTCDKIETPERETIQQYNLIRHI